MLGAFDWVSPKQW
ncbi:hypothetical protein IEO21_04140 [Rhodonia placenta]|uniref:Uncharacterized protein n=1 Tax=Rhodonia placenta TaxID=104341 RepID=A0A8H7P4E8_9APHY|nr:hypothetical protein IEO21_04140 [Postia placenta]